MTEKTKSIFDGAKFTAVLFNGADFAEPAKYFEFSLENGRNTICRGQRKNRGGAFDPPVCFANNDTSPEEFRMRLILNEADISKLFELERTFMDKAFQEGSERRRALEKLKTVIVKLSDDVNGLAATIIREFKPKGSCRKDDALSPIEDTSRLLSMFLPFACPAIHFETSVADLSVTAGFLEADLLADIQKIGISNSSEDIDIVTMIGGVSIAIMDIRWIEFPKTP